MTTTLNITLELESSDFGDLTTYFEHNLKGIFEQLVISAVQQNADRIKQQIEAETGHQYTWKSRTGSASRQTVIESKWGKIRVPQPEIQRKMPGKNRKLSLARLILGIDKMKRRPKVIPRMIALAGVFGTFRTAAQNILNFCGVKLHPMTIKRAIQSIQHEIDIGLIRDDIGIEADGTGVPIKRIKRGLELKVLAQRKPGGGLHFVHATVDRWKTGWDKVFMPLHRYRQITGQQIIRATLDGEPPLVKGLHRVAALSKPFGRAKISVQRCTWHIGKDLVMIMVQDKILQAHPAYHRLMSIARRAAYSKNPVYRRKHLRRLEIVSWICKANGWLRTYSYIRNMRNYLYTRFQRGWHPDSSGTTSLTERLMSEVKRRARIGHSWSPQGILDVIRIRLAYYYNGWRPSTREGCSLI